MAGSRACIERSRNEILQAWFRTGSAYTSNGVVEFVKQLLAHLPNRMRIIVRVDSGYVTTETLTLWQTHKKYGE